MRRSAAVLEILLLGACCASSQGDLPELKILPDSSTSRSWPLAGVVTVLFPLLLPKVVADATQLKDYIRSEEFSLVRRYSGDLSAVDRLFDRARELSWGNEYEALLLATVATFDHRRFGVSLPLLGPMLWFPLTAEFTDDYHARVNSLPAKLYCDTPRGISGDRDKLQHFFGSALITYFLESNEAANRVGDFIEWGEDRFIVDGVSDERDRRANRQGQHFGLRLLADSDVRPSEFLRCDVAESLSGAEVSCGRGVILQRAMAPMEEP